MNVQFGIRYRGTAASTEARLLAALGERFASVERHAEGGFEAHRGSRLHRVFSSEIERWPTRLVARLLPVTEDEGWISLDYEVATGWHLVGATDHLALEAEAAALEATIRGLNVGLARSALGRLRRPIALAIWLNVSLAAMVVCFVGLAAGFPFPWVVLAAVVVAILDAGFPESLSARIRPRPETTAGRRSGARPWSGDGRLPARSR
jgi:hypothetical protein